VGTLLVKFFQEKAKELLRILLVASMHIAKAGQFSYCRIDIFWGEGFAEIFKVVRLKPESQLVHGSSIDDFKLAHEQNPEKQSPSAKDEGKRLARQPTYIASMTGVSLLNW
jgi:hypothetical protein